MLNSQMLVAAAILVVSYVLIFTELLHRTSAAILGAVVMIAAGMALGFYSQDAAIAAIDANTLLLLAAMMMVVALLRTSGALEYVAVHITRWAKGSPRLLLIYLSLVVSLCSMILDNVTTVIVFAPLTVLICRLLKLNPLPFLMSEAMLSNIGGAATLVGDPPNIMIGSAGNLGFSLFLSHMGPPIAVVWCTTVLLLLFLFRKELASVERLDVTLQSRQAITDVAYLAKVLVALAVIIVLFFVHHHFELYPAYVAFIGLSLALVLLRPRPDDLFGAVNWSVLVFFAGLFVIVGGVEASGLLHLAAQSLVDMAQDPERLLLACLLLMWTAAVFSAVIDNIPFTITMIPVILSLETAGVAVAPLWWALAMGVGLGGNGTHIGATANLIAVNESEKCGIADARISPLQWLRIGVPTTLFGLMVVSVVFTVFFDFFR
jgi:Na+/H+ antiporter NhaD/arsenite permease-like protein